MKICPITWHARKTPLAPAIITTEKTLSYEELDALIEKVPCSEENPAVIQMGSLESLLALWVHLRKEIPVFPVRQDQSMPMPRWNLTKRPATLLFTSGSTSQPKIAMHSFDNHFYSALGWVMTVPINAQDRYLLNLPLYHVSGISILFRVFISGAALVIPSKNAVEDILRWNVTHISMVPTQLYRLKSLSEKELRCLGAQLKVVQIGGSALSEELYIYFQKLSFPLYVSYGMTEMSSTITISPPGSLFSSGFPLPYRTISLNEEGEVLVKGPTLFLGYLKESGAIWKPDEWFRTGDIGSFHPTTGLKILKRKDSMIVSGGENIQPGEIETALKNLSNVRKAKVFAVKDEEFGQKMVAFVAMDGIFDEKGLKTALRQMLPGYKIPKKICEFSDGGALQEFAEYLS